MTRAVNHAREISSVLLFRRFCYSLNPSFLKTFSSRGVKLSRVTGLIIILFGFAYELTLSHPIYFIKEYTYEFYYLSNSDTKENLSSIYGTSNVSRCSIFCFGPAWNNSVSRLLRLMTARILPDTCLREDCLARSA